MQAKLFLLSLLTATALLWPTPTMASGDQVKVYTDGDVRYLTTETDGTASAYVYRGERMNLLEGVGIQIPEGFARDIAQLINAVLSFVMVIAALLVLMYLIWGAFDWITSGGDKGKIEGARQKIVSAIIGLIVVSASYAILILAIRFLGFESLEDVFNSVRTLDGSTPVEYREDTATTSAKFVIQDE